MSLEEARWAKESAERELMTVRARSSEVTKLIASIQELHGILGDNFLKGSS